MLFELNKRLVKLGFKNLTKTKMRYLFILLAFLFIACNNPIDGTNQSQNIDYKTVNAINFITENYISCCDSIEYDYTNDLLIIHQSPCGQVIPEFSKFIASNKFKIKLTNTKQ